MSEANAYQHQPVLLTASVDQLVTDPDGTYVDITYGGGGHSRMILSWLSDKGRLIAFDRDETVTGQLIDDPRFTFIQADFRYLKKYLRYYRISSLHGILADLGLSSHHLDTAGRGFSYFSSMPLDMRMNKRQRLTAAHVIQEYSEKNLMQVFAEYGELTNARQMAAALVRERQKRVFRSCLEFAQWSESFAYGKKQKFLAQAFQAIRMEVNHELDSLKLLLSQSGEVLMKGGRLVVISYHSLEDRLVKNWIKNGSLDENESGEKIPAFQSLHKHAIKPEEDEIKFNSRSRSAKMRVAIKL